MAKIQTGEPIDLITMSKASAPLGDIKHSLLSEVDFNAENLGTWYLMDGRSCVGTTFEAVTGETTIPDAISNGEFLRQAKAGRNIGSAEGDAIRNITGSTGAHITGAANTNIAGNPFYWGTGHSGSMSGVSGNNQTIGWKFDASRQVPTAPENRPKNIAVNLFIKVEY